MTVDRNDIELTNEVVEVERRPRSGVVVSVRLSPEEADELQNIAEARHLTLSQVTREAIRFYLKGPIAKPTSQWPWTGTTSGGGHFELTYADFGSLIGTAGVSGEAPDPSSKGITSVA